MVALNEEQLHFLNEYLELMNIVDQGFQYVHNKGPDEQPATAERMLPDILAAFMQLNQAHNLLKNLFEDDEKVSNNIDTFNEIVSDIEEAQTSWEMPTHEMLLSVLYPRFQSWKHRTREWAQPFIQQ